MHISERLGRFWGLPAIVALAVLGGCKTDSGTSSGDQAAQSLTISGTPATAVASGQAYQFQPTVMTADRAPYTFSVNNKPRWATLNAGTGELAGTPTATDVGVYPGVIVTVSSSTHSAMLPAFSIEVHPAGGTGTTPTISGTPATSIGAGMPYTFNPVANDGDGEHLSFSIQNKPIWLSFDATTGHLTGSPTAADAGTYAYILITVTDGTFSVALPTFSITVIAAGAGAGSATLSWVAPTTNTDGTALTNLSGYHIYYGYSAGAMTHLITITNTGLTNYVVTNLSAGVWYFAVKAYNSANVDSDLSSIVHKTI